MPSVTTSGFTRASNAAIRDPKIQAALSRAGGGFDRARAEAVDELGAERWEELRDQASEIKRHTLDNLDYYLDLLCEKILANGGQVHFARDAAEANSIVCGIARSSGVKVAVKSKSMVSEEMGLNEALAEAGVEAVETDLGEYIIQLAEETPFHIIAPAMHKSRQDVSELFAEKLQSPKLEEIEDLARTARERLRQVFFEADMGVTGANFLVAETGTLVIITNEGNGRFCTSAPRVHVALAGMEKVVPSMDDLAVFLRLLPRAATGQRLTSYMSFVSGPRAAGEEDGPEEFHLVIVDNGRSRLLADPHLRQALACIRCGACLNICPVYRKVGGHAYGWVYPGPIGAVITPVMVGRGQAKDLPFASTLCGACREVCPVKIDIPDMLLRLRTQLSEGDGSDTAKARWTERALSGGYRRLMSSPSLLSWVRSAGRLLQALAPRKGKIAGVTLPLFSRWTRDRDLPALARKPFRRLWREGLSRVDQNSSRTKSE